MTLERLTDHDFLLADLESVPDTKWQQESWRNALRGYWLTMVQYRNGGGEDDEDPLLVATSAFMRKHEILIPPAIMGKSWTSILYGTRHENGFLSLIEEFKTHDPVDDPDAAVGFLLVEGLVLGRTAEIEELLTEAGASDSLGRVPAEYATRRLVSVLASGQSHAALSFARLFPSSLNGLRTHPLFPACLKDYFATVIAWEDEPMREEALQTFGSLLNEADIKQTAAEAVWLMIDTYRSPRDAKETIQRFGLDEDTLAAANSRRVVTSHIFNYNTVDDPIASKKVLDNYSSYPEISLALEDSLTHHIARQNKLDSWAWSLEQQADPWVEKILTKAKHKDLCWSLRMGRFDDVQRNWDKRSLGEQEQKEYRSAALLGFREACARNHIADAIQLRGLLDMTEEEISPITARTFKELVRATHFEDARRLAEQFSLPVADLHRVILDAKAQFIQDGDSQLVTEMRHSFNLSFLDAPATEDNHKNIVVEVHEHNAATDVLHETVRFYVNESLIATGEKIRDKFAQRGVSVPFRSAMGFEPIIQVAEQEIRSWQMQVRETILNGVVTEMIRNQNQVEDVEHTVIEDYENGSHEDAKAWRAAASDYEARRVLRRSVFRYGLAGWWPDRGGKLWQSVAEINLRLFSQPLPNTRAVDEAYDLIHHHGGFLIQPEDLAAVVLDIKRNARDNSDLLERSRPYIDAQVFTQLKSRLLSMKEAERTAERALAGY